MNRVMYVLILGFWTCFCQAQDATFNNLTINNLTKNDGAFGYFGWGNATDNVSDPRPNISLSSTPAYFINHHTGLTFSAHSVYGGIRFYNQGYPGAYNTSSGSIMAMSITGGNVGIGTTTPSSKLTVAGSSYFFSPANGSRYAPTDMLGNGAQIVVADPTNAVNNSTAAIQLNAFNAFGAIALDYTSTFYGDLMFGLNNGSYQVAEKMRITSAGNVGIGTTTPDARLAVNGTIHAKEVKVDLNFPGPDYVFEKNYHLRSLTDINRYIARHRHLPGVPSATDMAQNGISISEMNMKLLQKVEELTLYLIQVKKENSQLFSRLKKIENKK